MTFQEFSTYLDRSESVTSRTDITTILSDLFSSLSDDEVAIACYLITGRVAPLFVPVEFNVSIRTVLNVLSAVSGMFRVAMDVQREYGRMGDAGTLAESIIARATRLKKAKRQTMSLVEIYERLWDIVHVSGTGAKGLREKRILDVVTVLSPLEARYFIRIVGGQMRLGVSVKTLMDALSVAHAGDKRDREHIEHAFGVCSDLGYVASRYVKGGVSEIENLEVIPGTPVFSMLVEREKDLMSVFGRIPESIVQPKFDGLRCQ
ncbi:MAG: hypothetical protein PHG63_03470, partial [Candidatus Dojkabacteria bacterium]|nr:hypothetical protein [Candidatus Dojkabacteria bacterium]